MTFSRWTGSAWQQFSTYKRWTGSVWQSIANASRWNGSAWVQFGFLQTTLSPTSLNGSTNVAGDATTSGNCTVTPTGGSGSYTYSWNINTTVGNTITAVTPTAASTFFGAFVDGTHINANGTATCTVTDTVTGLVVTTSNSCAIHLTYTGP